MRLILFIFLFLFVQSARSDTIVSNLITSTGYYSNNVNGTQISVNHLVTVSNIQYAAWYDTNLNVMFTTRNLTSGALTNYGPFTSFFAGNDDEHRCIALEFDKNGIAHCLFGMHSQENYNAYYRTGTIPWSVSSWGPQSFSKFYNDTINGEVIAMTYPMLFKSPANELLSTFRHGDSANGDQILLWFNTTNGLWTNMMGMATNMIISGRGESNSAYMNGNPQYDANSNLWLTFTRYMGDGVNFFTGQMSNHMVMKWDGSVWKKWNGTTQTIPARVANETPALFTSAQIPTMGQNNFILQSNIMYLPYMRTNSAGIAQAYVAENHTGSFTEHQLTTFTNQPIANTRVTAICNTNGPVYVVFQNNSSPTNELRYYSSADNFTTKATGTIWTHYSPNFTPTFDNRHTASNQFSFLFMDADDYTYGLTYVDKSTNNTAKGNISIIDWTPAQQTMITPDQYLLGQPKPIFIPGNILPALTKDGWALGSNTTVVAARYFGYALDIGEIFPQFNLLSNMTNAGTFEYGMIQLAKNDPAHYKLSVHTDRQLQATLAIPSGFWCTNSSGQFVDNTTNWTDFNNPPVGHYAVASPEAPDSYWQSVSMSWSNEVASVRSNSPLAIVLNDGEYGMQEFGNYGRAWNKDPRVLAAAGSHVFPTSTNGYQDLDWWCQYATLRKSHQLGFQTKVFKQAVPDRQLYIYYNTGNEGNRTATSTNSVYGFDSTIFVTNSDLPSFEAYYQGYIGHDYTNSDAQTLDLLTQYLNSVGFNLKLGLTNNYSWLTAGSSSTSDDNPATNPALVDIPRYMGFLKCLYTGGMIGGNAGYYQIPPGGFDVEFPTNSPPHWLQQIQALAHVHAEFSYLTNYLYSGDLLTGPQSHRYSTDQPALEFTNTIAAANDRVLARKLRSGNQWLICAWAADGTNRNVTVTIPTLGNVTVLARDSGSVYTGTAANNLTLFDSNGLYPTEQFGQVSSLSRVSIGGKPIMRVIGGQP